ncbi:hypothetical protein Bca52824_080490 [Brassica carinata]|uniref:Uncharacterized protein n=1 Tax=Brassica carinata TaxID=52824 RepID=A0A8X7PDG1_BRACI|nr:hypothetical protein Bca52824_080490 [Brassica carinata]
MLEVETMQYIEAFETLLSNSNQHLHQRKIPLRYIMKFSQLTGMKKEIVQNLEWLEAQKIEISIDLIAESKKHLQFLGVVDCNQLLYDGHALKRAIYRYNAYWLPLLAKHSESTSICEGPLVPPFDCEWVWHCHRLNPVRYKSDCEEFYGRVLDNSGILSSANGSCKLQTEKLWKRLYPMESYDLDLDMAISEPISPLEKCTTYDLVSAAKRQSSFYLEVSRANVDSEIIMEEAVGRYKAFLYLIKENREKTIRLISVPTYDIDLIWHTHQLNPSSYYKDMVKIFGNILQHDDTADSHTSEGMNLDTVFSGTTAQWEETFGQRYWKASMDTTPHTSAMVETERSGAGSRCFAEAAEKSAKRQSSFYLEVSRANVDSEIIMEEVVGRYKAFLYLIKQNGEKTIKPICVLTYNIDLSWHTHQLNPSSYYKDMVKIFGNILQHDDTADSDTSEGMNLDTVYSRTTAQCEETFGQRYWKASMDTIPHTQLWWRLRRVMVIKSSARCSAMATRKNSARCFAVAAEKNGGLGSVNLMENNAKENAPLAEGATAA